MKKCEKHFIYGLIGISVGLTGLVSIPRCSGTCNACFGCAGVGMGMILILVCQKISNRKDGSDGMV